MSVIRRTPRGPSPTPVAWGTPPRPVPSQSVPPDSTLPGTSTRSPVPLGVLPLSYSSPPRVLEGHPVHLETTPSSGPYRAHRPQGPTALSHLRRVFGPHSGLPVPETSVRPTSSLLRHTGGEGSVTHHTLHPGRGRDILYSCNLGWDPGDHRFRSGITPPTYLPRTRIDWRGVD